MRSKKSPPLARHCDLRKRLRSPSPPKPSRPSRSNWRSFVPACSAWGPIWTRFRRPRGGLPRHPSWAAQALKSNLMRASHTISSIRNQIDNLAKNQTGKTRQELERINSELQRLGVNLDSLASGPRAILGRIWEQAGSY